MFVEINGVKYVVRFQHDTQGEQAISPNGKSVTINRYSKCVITLAESPEEAFVASGMAICHPKDNFNKEKGRQNALTRALLNANLAKEVRKFFWEKYRTWKINRF